MVGFWTLWKGGVMSTGIILFLVLINIMIVIAIILVGGMIGDTYLMNSINKNHLLLMEM